MDQYATRSQVAGARRCGLWLSGARGSVATTSIVGLYALSAGLVAETGCVTGNSDFAKVPLPKYSDFVVGGRDLTSIPLVKRAESLVEAGLLPHRVVAAVADRLAATDEEIIGPACVATPDPATAGASTQAELIDRLSDAMASFVARHALDVLIVIDVASTQPPVADLPEYREPDLLRAAVCEKNRAVLPASALTALAAVRVGAAYSCFTPSPTLGIPAVHRLADNSRLLCAGQDAKTGQTLLRTVLAPMFANRAMNVQSWSGSNLLGGGDGATLADPIAVQSKLASKQRGIQDMLGGNVTAPLHIDYVPDLGETKVAWDYVHATGFLGGQITLQTIWSAPDSALAAPLVLDVARLLAMARIRGVHGIVGQLGFFFKEPWASSTHSLAAQYEALVAWARSFSSSSKSFG
ncbi:Inositol-3-phosphate synthase [Mycobacterium basiliense]|uniref:Inositol-3-phosphate synthase n=1 Tax=Mycobacterium basiliense TaxID=2094119 RepID=A0A3S4BFE2_9MYCO|nr:inositol-3-phosphate synthase [Mycobacterium basiliense]VDM88770.1 Inositol-3-phosphate synthase [Mycobacterium basiliense]